MKGGNRYVDTVHISIIGVDPVCNVVDYNGADSDLAFNAGISNHDIWRHHDHTKHFQTTVK